MYFANKDYRKDYKNISDKFYKSLENKIFACVILDNVSEKLTFRFELI